MRTRPKESTLDVANRIANRIVRRPLLRSFNFVIRTRLQQVQRDEAVNAVITF